jgi:Na+/H+ antiporter NhaD/arsenite permease-like protein
VVDAAERRGLSLRLAEFAKIGVPLTTLTVAVLVGCLWRGI